MRKDPKKKKGKQPARAAGERPEQEPPEADASKGASQQDGQTPKPEEASQKETVATEDELPESLAKAQKWWRLIRRRPVYGILALCIIVIAPAVYGLTQLLPEQSRKLSCTVSGYFCPVAGPIKKDTVAISTTLPRCWRGYLSFKLRNTKQSATWGPGTENLTICANGDVSAEPGKLLEKFADRFSRCFVTTSNDGTTTVSLNYASGAVCRAPYKPAQSDFVPSTLVGGINVCVPELKNVANKDGQKFLAGKTKDTENWIYECDMTQLKQLEF